MTVSLSEQMGAMALVDELRHRDMELQDHLDLPRRRAEVAERIRAYYQNNGIHYEDAQVEEGVRAFFSRRLVFEAPALTRKDQLLVRLAMNRRALLTLVGAVLMIGTLMLCSAGIREMARTGEAIVAVNDLAKDDQALHQQLTLAQQRLAELQARLRRQPEPAVAVLLEQARSLLPASERHFTLEWSATAINSTNRDQVKAEAVRARVPLDQALQALATCQALFTTVEGIYQQRERLSRLRESPGFLAARPHFAELDSQAQAADQQLRSIRQPEQLLAVENLISQLNTQVDAASGPLAILDRQRQLLQRLKGMPLNSADRQQLMAQAGLAASAVDKRDWPAVEASLAQLQRYLDFTAQPLTVDIVDRPGIKSGVERCYEQADCSPGSERGKSWYLVVEALDASGSQVEVPVTSVEDGEQRWSNLFAVRISRAEYLKVKDDKLDDGHIGQRRIGLKPANALSLRFNARVSGKPDMILNW
ncbi:DUF6384 family protein [Pseudomonas oryziphila]|uniref:Uncharacterized protein n=1 Tax=Pseudomonas oryziphila TaxID=2894079 RepID=A0ABM7CV32_9PSED|nr:DUF6384 family protein [Pseudomonas oryziphila]AZL75351.1 hypothetical protein EI693_20625 [Pseudomonas oryziphila]